MYPANEYEIRLATEADAVTLHRLAALDGQKPFAGPALIAERDGVAIAAISLFDERVVADPFEPTLRAAQLLRMRLNALRAYSKTPSLTKRLHAAMSPFVEAQAAGSR
jgi:hypothetical protein